MTQTPTPTPTPLHATLPPDVDAWLRAGAGGGTPCDEVIETSISWIFLYRDRALKLKKPVDLGFVDFTTPEKRRWAAMRELDFNRATAPDVYRRVLAITRGAAGEPRFDGPGAAVDWALEMRRFDAEATLDNRLGAVDGAFAEALGRRIARFHLAAPLATRGGGAAGIAYVLTSNAQLLRGESSDLGTEAVEAVIGASQTAFEAAAPLLDRRLADGFARCCHGDLHLGNILLENGAPILFDCIEFSDALREIDVLYDIAFLLMDLSFRGADEAANRVLNGWLDEAARGFAPTLWEGMAALPLFLSVRAAVRSHVNAHQGAADLSRRYLAAARAHLAPVAPTLVAVGGLSGSGKSTLARALAPGVGRAPGAVVLRSDEIRKRLWGRKPTDRLPPEAYSRPAGEAVYAEMFAAAAACLAAGWTVVLDAAFLRPEERAHAREAARATGAAFHGLWLEASAETLRSRIAGRIDDASDADARVLDMQLNLDTGAIDWLRPGDAAAADTAERLQRGWGLAGRGEK